MEMQQIHELAAAYSAAGLEGTWAGGFLVKLSQNEEMPRGRGMAILSDLIAKGPPEGWPHWDLATDALAAAEKTPIRDDAEALRSIAGRVRAGNAITKNQVAYVERLIASAGLQQDLHEVGPDDAEWLRGIADKFRSTNHFYWEHRPGTHSRVSRAIKQFEATLPEGAPKAMPQESWSFLTEYYSKDWSEWNSCAGSFGELRRHGDEICLVIGPRAMERGQVSVAVMKAGSLTFVRYSDLKAAVRAPRKKKAV